MIKKVRHPDGTEETIEGTPEEIAAYERKLNEGTPSSKKKPPVLKGSEVVPNLEEVLRSDEFQRAVEKLMRELQAIRDKAPQYIPYWWAGTPQLIRCWICGNYDCHVNHIWCGVNDVTLTGNVVTSTTACAGDSSTGFYITAGQINGNEH